MIPLGILTQQQGGTSFPIPRVGLVSMLNAAVSDSLYTDLSKTTVANQGDPVAVWEDRSGNGNDWIQTNASYRPTAQPDNDRIYNTGNANTPANSYLTGPDISSWTEGSFFARVYASGGGGVWGTTSWVDGNSLNHWDWPPHYINFGVNSRPSIAAVGNNEWMQYENNVNSSGVMEVYKNGTNLHSADLGVTGFRSAPYLGCGVRSGGPDYAINAYYQRFCAYNRVLSAAERAQVNYWLEFGVGQPTGFTPNQISGLQTWLDGSDPGVTANEWQDKAIGGRGNYTKHPSYTMPTHDAGDDSIRFAGSHLMNGPSYSNMTEGEIFVRLKTDAGDHGLWYFSNKSDNGDWYPYTGSSAYLGWGQNARPSFGIGVPFTSYHTLNIWSATNDWAANVNGVNRATDASTIVGFVSAPYIGKMEAANYWLSGNIKALCIFDRKLTTEERTQMNSYMDGL